MYQNYLKDVYFLIKYFRRINAISAKASIHTLPYSSARKVEFRQSSSFGALLTDLSKVFGCLSYELLIAKLAAYGFRRSALKLMYTYLFDRKRRNKISIFYSLW